MENINKTKEFPIIDFSQEKDVLSLLNIGRTTLWRLRTKKLIDSYRIEGQKRIYYSYSQILNSIKKID